MRLILCTLAVCLSILASVFTTESLLRAEGKHIRSSIPKALNEPLTAGVGQESIVQKLDALNAQLASISRRLTLLEEATGRQGGTASATAAPALAETRALAATVRSIAASEARLAGVPGHLAELTTYLDRSFGHLEGKVDAVSTPDELYLTLDWLVGKVDDIDHYFKPLYAYLGVVYDPEHDALLADYPSLDLRINKLLDETEALKAAVADIRRNMMVPTVIEPTKRPR
jgi:hypothetical protein